jgi:hypothetical protein
MGIQLVGQSIPAKDRELRRDEQFIDIGLMVKF